MKEQKVRTMEFLLKNKEVKDIARQGTIFSTRRSNYFYDAGTGKVIELDDEGFQVLHALFDKTVNIHEFKRVLERIGENDAVKIAEFLENENLLQNPVITNFISLEDSFEEDNLRCEQLIIELTGNCNMCCKYCIYNEHYEGNRNFNIENIDFVTAQKAIDYIYAHRNPEHLAITFYGGEPLLNYDIMKQCIDYCRENLKECNLSFSFTTNLTLMTEEKAEYFAKIPGLNIIASIDGPEEIHDKARVYRGNQPTFKDVFQGLKNISNAIRKYNNTTMIFNCVFMPPYTNEKFEKINEFFESLDFLPEDLKVQATYPSPGTVPESYIEELKSEGIDAKRDDNWVSWARKKAFNRDFLGNRRNLYSAPIETSLAHIHNRILYEKPMNLNFYNGCCVPGQRRLYLTTKGEYKICERVGNAPNIGNVNAGLDFSAIRKYYLSDYEKASISDCSNCWAIHLCDICYASCYDENGIDILKKRSLCKDVRERYKMWLTQYYEVLETSPERIEEIAKMQFG